MSLASVDATIARLDALSRTRALDDRESRTLGNAIRDRDYHERIARNHRADRRAGTAPTRHTLSDAPAAPPAGVSDPCRPIGSTRSAAEPQTGASPC